MQNNSEEIRCGISAHRGGVPSVRQFCNRILHIAACFQTRSLIAIKVFQFVPLELGNPETTWLSNCVARVKANDDFTASCHVLAE